MIRILIGILALSLLTNVLLYRSTVGKTEELSVARQSIIELENVNLSMEKAYANKQKQCELEASLALQLSEDQKQESNKKESVLTRLQSISAPKQEALNETEYVDLDGRLDPNVTRLFREIGL